MKLDRRSFFKLLGALSASAALPAVPAVLRPVAVGEASPLLKAASMPLANVVRHITVKVSELIEELQKTPQDAEVYIYEDKPGTTGVDHGERPKTYEELA